MRILHIIGTLDLNWGGPVESLRQMTKELKRAGHQSEILTLDMKNPNVEAGFSELKGTERSLYFSSGFQANIGVLQAFLEEGDVVFSDELNHASLIDGIRLSKAKK